MSDPFSSFLRDEVAAVSAIAEITGVSKSTVYAWIRKGQLKTTKRGRTLTVGYHENQEFLTQQLQRYWKKPQAAFIPKEIERYGKWHELIDEIVWLIKVFYSTPEAIRKRQFRLDELFTKFLNLHKVNLRSLKQALRSQGAANLKLICDDLKRGWYNELAYCLPLRESTLGLTFNDVERNKPKAVERFGFPSWRITISYYAIYFYLRSVTLQKQANLRLQEHGATINAFKGNLLSPLSRVIWKAPFDICSGSGVRAQGTRLFLKKLSHLKNKYSLHPRAPHRSPAQLVNHIVQVFRTSGRRKSKSMHYTLFDYLHDFRVWANYLEIDNLLSLSGAGYKSILDQNISTILFFVGGMTELCYIAMFGDKEYSKALQSFYNLVVANESLRENEFPYIPHYQRLAIYRNLGLSKVNISRLKPDANAVRVEVLPD